MSLEFVSVIVINVMMLMTNKHKRSLLQKRTNSPSFEIRGTQERKSFKDKPIQIFLDLSLRNDDFIHFRTITEKNKFLVKRAFSEFVDIENYLLEYMQHTFPERIQDVPIIDKSEIISSSNISMAVERKFQNIDNFLQKVSARKEFWSKEVLEFLGLETEEAQTNYLAQHDKYLQVHKHSIITESAIEVHEKSYEESKAFLHPYGQYKQSTPKTQSQPSQANMKRRTTYYNEKPQIIENYNAVAETSDNEPNRKMLKVSVTDFKKVYEEVTYTIYVEYLEGKNWKIFKTFAEIMNHRRKISKLYRNLKLPTITQGQATDDQVAMEKRKYEVQGYINYLLKSQAAYKEFLSFIEFEKYSAFNTSSSSDSKIEVIEPSTTLAHELLYEINHRKKQREPHSKGTGLSAVSLNQEESLDIMSSIKNNEDLLDHIHKDKQDDSDEEF